MKIPAFFLVDQVTIEAYQGQTAVGPSYAAPVTVKCKINEGRRLVRDAQGRQVISEAQLLLPLATVIPAESRVTLNGRTTTVLSTKAWTGNGTLVVPEHIAAVLQ